MEKIKKLIKEKIIIILLLIVIFIHTVTLFISVVYFNSAHMSAIKYVEDFGIDLMVIIKTDLKDSRMQAITNGTLEETLTLFKEESIRNKKLFRKLQNDKRNRIRK